MNFIYETRFNDAECSGTECDDYTHSPDCDLYEAYIDGPSTPDAKEDDEGHTCPACYGCTACHDPYAEPWEHNRGTI